MKFISHRGNLNGRRPQEENNPEYVLKAISLGYDVEVDLRKQGDKFFLGHDYAQYEIDNSFLTNNSSNLWVHAKDLCSLNWLIACGVGLNFFWHEEDSFSVTSKGYIWTFPKKQLTNISICVMPEYSDYSINEIQKTSGVCSDNIVEYRKRCHENIQHK